MLGRQFFNSSAYFYRASQYLGRAHYFNRVAELPAYIKSLVVPSSKNIQIGLRDGLIVKLRIESQEDLEKLLAMSRAVALIESEAKGEKRALLKELEDLTWKPVYNLVYKDDEAEDEVSKKISIVLRDGHVGRLHVETQEGLDQLLGRSGAVALIEGKQSKGPFVLRTNLKDLTSNQFYYFAYGYDRSFTYLGDKKNIHLNGGKKEVKVEDEEEDAKEQRTGGRRSVRRRLDERSTKTRR